MNRRDLLRASIAISALSKASMDVVSARPLRDDAPFFGAAVREQFYQLTPYLDDLVALTHLNPEVLLYFANFDDTWHGQAIESTFTRGLVAMASINSTAPDVLRRLNDGEFDANLRQLARFSRGKPMIIRPLWEMNGNWMPHGRQPKPFIAAWWRLRRLWQEENNSSPFFWCPNETGGASVDSNLGAYFPGDDGCEFVGLDGYGTIKDPRSFSEIFDHDLRTLSKLSRRPIIIGETGADMRLSGGQSRWIQGMFGYLSKCQLDIIGLNWFNRDEFTLSTSEAGQVFRTGFDAWSRAWIYRRMITP